VACLLNVAELLRRQATRLPHKFLPGILVEDQRESSSSQQERNDDRCASADNELAGGDYSGCVTSNTWLLLVAKREGSYMASSFAGKA
jgi:hypothetical protein